MLFSDWQKKSAKLKVKSCTEHMVTLEQQLFFYLNMLQAWNLKHDNVENPYLCTQRTISVQNLLPGTSGVNNAYKREEVEGDLVLQLTELISLPPSHKAAVQVAALPTWRDEQVRVPKRVLQLLHRDPRLCMLHQLHALELLQLAGLPVPFNRLCGLHNHWDQTVRIHTGELNDAGYLTHAIPECHALGGWFVTWSTSVLRDSRRLNLRRRAPFLKRNHGIIATLPDSWGLISTKFSVTLTGQYGPLWKEHGIETSQ